MCRKYAAIVENVQKICSYCRKCAENMQLLQKMCRKSAGIAENVKKICRKSAGIACPSRHLPFGYDSRDYQYP